MQLGYHIQLVTSLEKCRVKTTKKISMVTLIKIIFFITASLAIINSIWAMQADAAGTSIFTHTETNVMLAHNIAMILIAIVVIGFLKKK